MRMSERSLRRARNIAAAFAIAGIGVLVWGFAGIDGEASVNPVTVIVLTAGGITLIGGFVTAWAEQFQLREFRRTRRGENVVARWRVDRRLWQQLDVLDLALAKDSATPPNKLAKPADVPPEGVEVIVGLEMLAVGDDVHFHYQRRVHVTLLPGPPMCLQFIQRGSDDGEWETCVRFPVGTNAQDDAARVLNHFNADAN